MIPLDWLPYRREDDDELVGYLAPDDDLFLPMSLLGLPLGAPGSAEHAGGILTVDGLRSLDGTWVCRLPNHMPPGAVDASDPAPEWTWRSVVIAELTPNACRVRLAMAAPEEMKVNAFLPLPVRDLLRRP